MHYLEKGYLNKKDIEFLEKLEMRLQEQAQAKTKKVEDKLLISTREFQKFWAIVDKIECNHYNHLKVSTEGIKERRKIDKDYARPYYMKAYHKDKEKAKKEGVPFKKTINDYKKMLGGE